MIIGNDCIFEEVIVYKNVYNTVCLTRKSNYMTQQSTDRFAIKLGKRWIIKIKK